MAITLKWHVPEHLEQKRLFSDEFVVIHRQGHPFQGNKVTLKKYLSAAHMMVSPLGDVFGPIDEILSSFGHSRTVKLVVPYFMQVADALLQSDLLLTLQPRTCEELMKSYPLAISDLPLKVRPVNYTCSGTNVTTRILRASGYASSVPTSSTPDTS